MKCKNCGKEIDDDSLFCEFCGAKVTLENSVEHPNQRFIIPKWIYAIIVLLAGLIIYFVIPKYHKYYSGEEKGHQFVDLGLSVKWATCNICYTNDIITAPGETVAWGEIAGKLNFTWDTYVFCDSSSDKLNKYNSNAQYSIVDNRTTLEFKDDIANVRWGGRWRMPTKEELDELSSLCTWKKTRYKGQKGYKVTSKIKGYEDCSIFLPLRSEGWNELWSSSLDPNNPMLAYNLYYNLKSHVIINTNRYEGISIRAVCDFNIRNERSENETSHDIIISNSSQSTSFESPYTSNEMVDMNGHDCVDLGLSVKWATNNVGATKPEDYGDYFAWGEISTKNDYSWSTYKYCNGDYYKLTKYCNDGALGNSEYTDSRTTLTTADDVASQKWGDSWRIPTITEFQELIDNCTWTRTTQNGVDGYKVASKKSGYTNNSIFIPCTGHRKSASLGSVGSVGYYWSSSLNKENPNGAWYLFLSGNQQMSYCGRCDGLSVRPVCP